MKQAKGSADPQPRIIRRPDVTGKSGLSATTLWREIKAGRFPKPVALGRRAVGWIEAEVDAWIEARARARDE